MTDKNTQVKWTDGEGITFGDLERAQSLASYKAHRQTCNPEGVLGALDFGHTTGNVGATPGDGNYTGGAHPYSEPGAGGIPSIPVGILLPNALGFVHEVFEISGAGDLSFSHWAQTVAQVSRFGTPGTPPVGFNGLMVHTLGENPLSLGGASPAADSRIDSIGIRLGHATGNPESRDFQDEVTRAITTSLTDKDQEISYENELIQGVESATPITPAQTAGYDRFVTILREVGETSLNPLNVAFHAFPMNLKTEIVWAKDMAFDPAIFAATAPSFIDLERSAVGVGLGLGGLVAMSKKMNEGSRLVGIGVGFNEAVDDALSVRLIRYDIDATGVATEVELQEIGNGTPLSAGVNLGFQFAGLADFDEPYWGNGHTRGPLLSNLNANPMQNVATSQLGVTIGGPGGAPWVLGGGVHFVKFYYLE